MNLRAYDQAKCRHCHKPFLKKTKPSHSYVVGVKPKNRVTCSRVCARAYAISQIRRAHDKKTNK